jgi:hypothetical protein
LSKSAYTHVTFVTKLFNTEDVREYFINPRCFGDDCAQWLIDLLILQGVDAVDEKPAQEDWGWFFNIVAGRQNFMVCVGLLEDEDSPNTWLLFIESQSGWLSGKLFGRSGDAELLSVCRGVDRALKSSTDISVVRWYTEENWMKGGNGNWRSDPGES